MSGGWADTSKNNTPVLSSLLFECRTHLRFGRSSLLPSISMTGVVGRMVLTTVSIALDASQHGHPNAHALPQVSTKPCHRVFTTGVVAERSALKDRTGRSSSGSTKRQHNAPVAGKNRKTWQRQQRKCTSSRSGYETYSRGLQHSNSHSNRSSRSSSQE